MNVEIQSTTKSLDQCYCAGLCRGFGVTSFVNPLSRNVQVRRTSAIALTLKSDDQILAFREKDRAERPWIYL